MSYIKQESGGGSGDITGNGVAPRIAFYDGAKSITSDADFQVSTAESRMVLSGNGLRIPAGSESVPTLSITGDLDTGIFSPGANQISLAVGGSDGLGVGANKNVTVGGASGTAGQVLTSGGAGGATTWTTVSGGSAQFAYAPQLNADIYAASSSLQSLYPLMASGQSGAATVASNWVPNTTTTDLHFMPVIMPSSGTLSGLQFRTGSSSPGDTLHVGMYASDSDGLPNGAAVFTNTITTPTINTSYNPSISISGITKGDLYYFAVFGQANRTQMHVVNLQSGGTFIVPRGLSVVNYSVGADFTTFRLGGQTNGVFPTLSASTQYTGSLEIDKALRAGIIFS